MKNHFTIFLLSLYVFSATELHELAKFPTLISHFFEHKQENAGLSLTDFLMSHYASHSNDNSKNADDEKLPFKSHSEISGWFLYNSLPPQSNEFTFHDFERGINFKTAFNHILPSSVLNSIWQPPKMV